MMVRGVEVCASRWPWVGGYMSVFSCVAVCVHIMLFVLSARNVERLVKLHVPLSCADS